MSTAITVLIDDWTASDRCLTRMPEGPQTS